MSINKQEPPMHMVEERISEARLALMMNDASIDQMLALDTGLRIIAWNRACEQFSGLPRETVIGRPFTDVYPKAAVFPAVMEAIVNALKGFKSFVSRENGAYAEGYFEHHFIPLRKEDGTVTGVLNIIHDVAHRVKAEQELQSMNRILSRKNKTLKHQTEELANFNWIASHDLKEPLRKIYTFIEMVATKEGQKISDTARSNLRRAQSAVQRMGLLTDDIVTFSQVTAPTEKLSEVNLHHALVLAQHQHQKTLEDTGAIIKADPLPVIMGYPDLMQHLWFHMLGNALKFQEEGAVPELHISYARISGKDTGSPDADGDAFYHCLTFSDNGIGFNMEYSEKIFGMFQRLHAQGIYRGTGTGLTICRKIAEAHDGFISVNSIEGQGTTFSCYLKDLSGTESTEETLVMA